MYGRARETELARQEQQMQGVLEQKKEEAETAQTPEEQFIAAWQYLIAESQAGTGPSP